MRIIHKAILVTAVIALSLSLCATAQDTRPKFEVASVKPAAEGAPVRRLGSSGTRFFATNIPLRALLQTAYRPADGSVLLNNRIIGGPSWIDTDHFDVEATAPTAQVGPIPQQKLQPMLRALLEDRFKLKAHYERKELPIYQMVSIKGKQALKRADDQHIVDSPASYDANSPPPPGTIRVIPDLPKGIFVLRGTAITLAALATELSIYAGRVVIDDTHLDGRFDVRLEFNPNLTPQPGADAKGDSGLPMIFKALQEQLGLKLESARGPVEVLVIDSVSKPSEN